MPVPTLVLLTLWWGSCSGKGEQLFSGSGAKGGTAASWMEQPRATGAAASPEAWKGSQGMAGREGCSPTPPQSQEDTSQPQTTSRTLGFKERWDEGEIKLPFMHSSALLPAPVLFFQHLMLSRCHPEFVPFHLKLSLWSCCKPQPESITQHTSQSIKK